MITLQCTKRTAQQDHFKLPVQMKQPCKNATFEKCMMQLQSAFLPDQQPNTQMILSSCMFKTKGEI